MSDPIDIAQARSDKERRQLADAILEQIGGPPAELLADVIGGAPEEIRDALLEAAERQGMYKALAQEHAAADEQHGIPADQCFNSPCSHWREGRCAQGVENAQTCLFRMVELPPGDPFRRLPSHAEALRMLMRAGLLEPDSFGHWNGTDFAFKLATRALWFAFIDLLIKTGKVTSTDRSDVAEEALVMIGFPRHRQEPIP